ncbi:beta-1,3-galactosyltransferase 5-like [Mya arenaria]|uniref:beta-1,3-galactosyltransferase 5-like n=1 Tax=Mya arenaria TaxID=6604 RepID=UPI0022E78381|nr:beta-1,3-galactosyltransferase 5-like [Mya arenaria]
MLGLTNNATAQNDLKDESDVYHDIVQYEFVDSYKNLTIKTILGFQHAVKYCPKAKFILKVDSDVYVNVPAISHLLHNYEENKTELHIPNVKEAATKQQMPTNVLEIVKTQAKNGIFGLLLNDSAPFRMDASHNIFQKWVVSKSEYPRDKYPDYLDGHGYVLPINVARELVQVSPSVPFFRLEDVYVGLCMESLGYTIEHTSGFLRLPTPVTTCSHKNTHVYLVHGVNASRMRTVWEAKCHDHGLAAIELANWNNRWIKMTT